MDRKEFESDLLSNNISEKYLNKSNEELEERFGSEFLKTVNYGSQNNINHIYDLFEHILKTVDNLDVSGLSEKDALTIKIAAFFHDIGKPDVAQLNQKTMALREENNTRRIEANRLRENNEAIKRQNQQLREKKID